MAGTAACRRTDQELASRGVALALAGKLHLIQRWLGAHRVGEPVDHPRLFSTLEDAIEAYRPRQGTLPGAGLVQRVKCQSGEVAPGIG